MRKFALLAAALLLAACASTPPPAQCPNGQNVCPGGAAGEPSFWQKLGSVLP